MKKLLSIALCAAATLAFAEDVSVAVANVGVTKIEIPANQKNTIIASSFNALGGEEGVTIEKLIRSATGLAADDQLMIFKDNTYYSFKWNATDQKWEASTAITSAGTSTENTLLTSATTIGQGIWFIRAATDLSSTVTLVLYGATPTTTNVATTKGAWNLIGNPTVNTFTFTDDFGTKGDQIVVVSNGALVNYVRKSNGWYTTGSDGKTVKGKPTVAAGFGIWYNPKSATSFNWTSNAN